ncbi:unnamed protein product (macronuclear) [Paramecium tetraurelia]|uniref:Uncharacterized protein n=1 Tax=Paramecium tetraurelia TaxID=5888 RepID=A0BYC8_PARTE|nr:uncharacterized protein GSPATT00033398001 [Paramecium tetraurelia]CAK63545.1 unnamed protein product [Paramecium tetraurelia]|eukprot:XP_001430943.1 hypothetical protein (macronuclear) [Paramecium tetraurelia strain d4-2]
MINHSTKSYSNNELKTEVNLDKSYNSLRIILHGMNKDKRRSQERLVNQLFVRLIKQKREALEIEEHLNKMLLVIFQMTIHLNQSKRKQLINLVNKNEVKTFLNLVQTQQKEGVSRGATLAERCLAFLESLEANLKCLCWQFGYLNPSSFGVISKVKDHIKRISRCPRTSISRLRIQESQLC